MSINYGMNQMPSTIYYHHSTSNKSFIDMALYLKDIGIKNYRFMLVLLDPDLAGVDPYDPRLDGRMKTKIFRECLCNPWYFIREVVRIPENGKPGGTQFKLHRGNLAILYCLVLNLNVMAILPRQTGKTYTAVVWYLWLFNFGASSSELSFLNKKFEDAKNNLLRIKDTRDLLPEYLKMDRLIGNAGNKLKGRESVERIEHPINKNRIRAVASATSMAAAASLLRGRTTPLIYIDEYAWLKYNKTIYLNMVPAWNTAANNARQNIKPYGILITTTPGMLATEEGEYCYKTMDNATKFSERWYDLSYYELMDIINTNANSTFVFIQFTYQQLGYSEEWFKTLCKTMELDWDSIRREVLLEWSPSVENSPFKKEDLDIIRGQLRAPISSFMVYNKYTVFVYEKMDPRHVPLIGVDVSGAYHHDSSAITIVDSWTTKVTAEFNCNWIPTLDLAALIVELVTKFMPNALVNIERNGGFGATVISKLLTTSVKKNLFFTIKDRVIEERYGVGMNITKRKQKTKVYGSDSTHEEREKLMEILRNRVDYHKDKIISKTIYDELCGLEVKKSGRIEHNSNSHDDQIFSWLWALYPLYEGGDLMRNWGIQRHEIKTDTDIDEVLYDFDGTKEKVDIDTDINQENEEIIEEQLKQIRDSGGSILYHEWINMEQKKDEDCLHKLLMNKKVKEDYAKANHLNIAEVENSTIETLPPEVFLNYTPDELPAVDNGNLSGMYQKLLKTFGR